jgi:molybdate transport system substrate-binding protein
MTTPNTEFRVMTSGAFTAAYKSLIPQIGRLTGKTVVTVTTSIGTGDISIPNRLKRGEVADIVIVADGVLRQFITDGLVLAENATVIARSLMGFAVRAGAPDPQIRTADDLKRMLLAAKGIGYSASESGKYYTTEIVQRLGIADQVLPKSRLVGGGERVGAVIARGELDFGFQQISELLPVPGIAHITPLPPELQKASLFTAGIGANSPDREAARKVIAFLASAEARQAIADSGLEPVAG